MVYVTLAVWLVTAAIGMSLLVTGGSRRAAAGAAGGIALAAHAPQDDAPQDDPGAPATGQENQPDIPRTRVTTPPGEHPVLEFSHPALALAGLGCWLMFVFARYQPLAWISLALLAAAVSLGLGWLARCALARRRHVATAWSFPRRLAAVHGLAAAVLAALAVLSALSASHSATVGHPPVRAGGQGAGHHRPPVVARPPAQAQNSPVQPPER